MGLGKLNCRREKIESGVENSLTRLGLLWSRGQPECEEGKKNHGGSPGDLDFSALFQGNGARSIKCVGRYFGGKNTEGQ